MTELLADPRYTLDHGAASAPWCSDSVSALRNRLRTQDPSYKVVIDHTRTVRATLVDTFDWRVLASGRLAILLEAGRDTRNHAKEGPRLEMMDYAYQQTRHEKESAPNGHGVERSLPVPTPIAPEAASQRDVAELSCSVAPRVLLRMGFGEVSFRRGRVLNGTGKTVAILDEVTLDGPGDSDDRHRPLRFLLLRPLRGYRRYVASIPRGIPVGMEGVIDALAARADRRPFDFDTRLDLPIRRDDDPEAAHRHIVSRLVGTMATVRPGLGLGADPEFLHDYRVAIRRLRSYLKESGLGSLPAAAPAHGVWYAVDRIDAVWQATGAARDLDVFLLRRDHYLRAAPAPLRHEVEHLFRDISRSREKRYNAMFALLPGNYEIDLEEELLARGPASRYGAVSGKSNTEPGAPDGARADGERLDLRATRWVRRREKKFLKLVARLQNAYVAAGTELEDEKIHAARKAAKKYRYLHEIFSSVLDESEHAPKRVKRLRKLQNLLGTYNDLVLEEARFHEILKRRSEESSGDVRAATAYMLAQVEREKGIAREKVLTELAREVR
ncbi:MAG: CHAD domain-containing protein [Alkalispirochaeta sp.]